GDVRVPIWRLVDAEKETGEMDGMTGGPDGLQKIRAVVPETDGVAEPSAFQTGKEIESWQIGIPSGAGLIENGDQIGNAIAVQIAEVDEPPRRALPAAERSRWGRERGPSLRGEDRPVAALPRTADHHRTEGRQQVMVLAEGVTFG